MRGLLRRPAILLATAWVVLVAVPAGVREVMPPDEPRFALVAREMRERVAGGDVSSLIVPHLAGRVYTDKPPVLFWGINAAAMPLGGVNEFAARVPSILAALATLLLTVRAGRRLLGSEAAGLAAALVLLTSSEFFQRSQWCSTDMTLTALATAGGLAWSEAAFACTQKTPARPRLLAALGWLAVAFAALTKGPVGLIWALLWPLCEAIARRSFRPLRVILSPSGIGLFMLVCGGWLALAESISPGFVSAVLWHQSVERYMNAWNNVQPFWFYLYQFPLDFLPWSLLLPVCALLAWRTRGAAEPFAMARRASALLLLAGLVFFSTSSGKRGVYLLPGFPAAAIFVTATLAGAAGAAATALRRVPGIVFALLGAAIVIAGVPWAWRLPGPGVAAGLASAGAAIGGLALAFAGLAARRRAGAGDGAGALRLLAGGLMPLFFVAATLGGALASEHQAAAGFGRLVATQVPPGEAVAIERGKFELIVYYAGREGFEFEESKQLLDRIRAGDARFAVVEKSSWEAALPEEQLTGLHPIAEGRISDTEYIIATIKPQENSR